MIPLSVALGGSGLALVGRSLARSADAPGRALAASTAAGAGLCLAIVAASGLGAAFSPWDTVRLAPAMCLARGWNPYAAADSGAVLSTMYGPVAMIAYLPAAMATDPATAAMLGRWLAFAFCALPLAVAARAFNLGPGRAWRWAILALATLAMLLCPSLRYATTYLHADAPALGLMGVACLLASRPGGPGFGAAVACVLALGTKQTLAPLPLALLAYAWWTIGTRSAAGFAARLAAVGAVALGVTLAAFDARTLWLNLVQIPSAVPWRGHAPWNLVGSTAELGEHAAPLILASLIAWRGTIVHESSRRRANVFLIAAIALAPMAVLGRVKQAGDVNSFAPALYPLLLAAAGRASGIAVPARPSARVGLAAILAGLCLLAGTQLVGEVRALAKERSRDAEVAYLADHPGEVYFPWNPSAHLAAEGRPTHHLFSAWERGVAGFPVDENHLRSALPPGCRYVAFPLKRLGPVVGFGSCLELLERFDLVAQPARPVRLAGLPDYECYALTR